MTTSSANSNTFLRPFKRQRGEVLSINKIVEIAEPCDRPQLIVWRGPASPSNGIETVRSVPKEPIQSQSCGGHPCVLIVDLRVLLPRRTDQMFLCCQEQRQMPSIFYLEHSLYHELDKQLILRRVRRKGTDLLTSNNFEFNGNPCYASRDKSFQTFTKD